MGIQSKFIVPPVKLTVTGSTSMQREKKAFEIFAKIKKRTGKMLPSWDNDDLLRQIKRAILEEVKIGLGEWEQFIKPLY